MIQGFNQDGQHGAINIVLEIDDFLTRVDCQVIDAITTYNLLLGRPWMHKYKVVPSTDTASMFQVLS